jgi:Flp pilus assembly protein TadG
MPSRKSAAAACKDDSRGSLVESAVAGAVCKSIRARLRSGNEDGQALIELALSVPMLLLLVTAIVSFGIVLNSYLDLTNATNASAQALSISRGQTSDPCATTVSAFESAAPTLNTSSLGFTIALNGVNVGGTSCPTATLVEGQPAQVTVTYPCNFSFIYNFAPPSCTLKALTTEAIQ